MANASISGHRLRFRCDASPPPPPTSATPPPPAAVRCRRACGIARRSIPHQAWYPDSSPVTLGMKFRSDAGGASAESAFTKDRRGTTVPTSGCCIRRREHYWHRRLLQRECVGMADRDVLQPGQPSTPNTTYIAAYFTTSGYAASRYFFTSNSVNNGPLHALQTSRGRRATACTSMPRRRNSRPIAIKTRTIGWMWCSRPAPPTQRSVSLYNGAPTPGEHWYPDGKSCNSGDEVPQRRRGQGNGDALLEGRRGQQRHDIALLYSSTGQLWRKLRSPEKPRRDGRR